MTIVKLKATIDDREYRIDREFYIMPKKARNKVVQEYLIRAAGVIGKRWEKEKDNVE